ncbi:transcriptional repressor [Deinococcus irradiatisoli]|uniref:Transcriptional repressor n=1 Tax=Deinococcus irradiatisoli TaxID=2202254 RepID=A0A2Z3JLQ3_9DEIO|nr:Fur family transcriptional regulator [Deinococcus irradiatisoli]AWN24471.1 transcriptional repressor [Deinococcus irradiatisoli]
MTPSELHLHLERRGLRVTQPRLTLLEFFAHTHGHFTPEGIFEQLRAAGQPLSIATLYQNLRTFTEHGLIKEMIGQGGEVRYDTNLEPHSHLICTHCGAMLDVQIDLPEWQLGGQGQGWLVAQARIDLHGVCPGCQQLAL